MAVILTPDKWRRQPSGPVVIDKSSPFAVGLRVAYAPWLGDRNLVTGVALTLTGTDSSIKPGIGGVGRVWTGASSNTYLNEPIALTGPCTFLGVIRPDAADAPIIRNRSVAEGNGGQLLRLSSSLRATYTTVGLGDYGSDTINPPLVVGQLGCVALSLSGQGTTSYQFFTDGRSGSSGTSGSTTPGTSYDIGSTPDGAAYQGRKALYLVLAWTRQLSGAEGAEITARPWQIFRKQPRILYFTAPSGGGATIAGDSGTYTLTGAAVTLKAGRKLAADSGTYSLTGTDVSLKVGRKLAADSGAYTLTGTDVAFKRGYALVASSGTYTVSGTAVSLKAGRKLAADSGNYTLTGTDATLTYAPAGSYNLTAESGSYSLTGTAATLRVSRKLTAESGTYSLAGTTATLAKGVRMAAASGSYTLTGSNVSFARTYVLTAESGSYTLTGTSAGLTWSGAPVVEVPTNGGPSIYGKPVFREREFRREYEEQVKRIEDEKRLARILREDEEIICIMALMAA